MKITSAALLTCLIGATLAPTSATAQSFGDRLKKRAEDAAKRSVEERVVRTAGETTDRALDGVAGAVADQKPASSATAQASAAAAPEAAPAGNTAPERALRPGEGAWLNYDFKPGERPLFIDDFARDVVGDFPRRLQFDEGNMEVVEWQGARYLRAAGGKGEFIIPLKEVLPDRFTMEFDFAGVNKYELKLSFNGDPANPTDQVVIGAWGSGVLGKVKATTRMPEGIDDRVVRVRVMADGDYVKVYVDSQRVANVPNAKLGRTNQIHVSLPAYGVVALIGDIRVLAGGRDLYDALSEKGRVATQGIYFATGSDEIRPESTPTLKEIAAMLTEHGSLALTIEGHTDNVGTAPANQALSQRRAEAVKAYLVDKHGVSEGRLTATGLGDTKPTAPNTTTEGRQQNRRVELVKG